jgi:glutamate-1-semialdehyde aminotransferase
MGRSQDLYKKAKKLIPGGTQLLSKRPEMFLPKFWPAYYNKAKGCEIWDLEGNRYIDMSNMGVGSCILGYADDDVNKAVSLAIEKGNMSTLNAPEEVRLAELLLKLHPWAQMVRYARTGGEAMAIAVRIARAYSKKDIVLFCGYHGWHDWYLSANLSSDKALDGHLLLGLNPLGVPRKLKGTAYPFNYNDTKGFLELINKYKNKVGVVVLESIRSQYPEKSFIQTIRDVTERLKIVLVIDEITAGFRINVGGAHLLFGLKPDIAVFAKGISNGFSMAAIIGRRKIMEVAQDTFISSTYWTDRIGPVAALTTIKKIQKNRVPEYLIKVGKQIRDGWKSLASKHNLDINISGIYPLSNFSFVHNNPLVLKTLFTQIMLQKGFLASNAFYASYAHKNRHVEKYLSAVDEAFRFISTTIKEGKCRQYLRGPICHSGFRRLA